MALSDGMTLTPELRGRFVYDVLGDDRNLTANLIDDATTTNWQATTPKSLAAMCCLRHGVALLGRFEGGNFQAPAHPPETKTRLTTSGSFSMILSNAAAGPLMLRLPCSHLR